MRTAPRLTTSAVVAAAAAEGGGIDVHADVQPNGLLTARQRRMALVQAPYNATDHWEGTGAECLEGNRRCRTRLLRGKREDVWCALTRAQGADVARLVAPVNTSGAAIKGDTNVPISGRPVLVRCTQPMVAKR